MVLAFVFVWILSGCFRDILTLNCEAGEYEQDDICTPCPSPCTKCINNLICTDCKSGFYGTTCEKQCSESCNERKCLQENGQCLSCVSGHYFGGNKSCVVCPPNCKECLSGDKCTSCKVGFKGYTCKEECINCRQGTGCTLETGVCISGCQDGYTGHSCLISCNSKCQSCERIDANKCTVCTEGRYGINCEKTCPANCKNKKCNHDNRICTDGCKEEYWGDRCENTCPKQCLRGMCSKENGMCSYGCRDNFTGSNCLCPDKCECSAEGVCEKCSNQSDYLCDNLCRTACVENICVSGVQTKCLYGYREGYDGSLCSLESLSSQLIPAVIALAIVAMFALIVSIIIIKHRKRMKCYQDALSEDEQPMFPRKNQFKSTRISRKEIELLANKSKHEIRQEFKDIIDSLTSVPLNVVRGGALDAFKINGITRQEAYIACNAPNKNNEVDFWEMVWREKCDKIVHLSRDGAQSEDSQYKYWKKRDNWRKCGHVRVKPYVKDKKEYSSADIELNQEQTSRCVTQFGYTIGIRDECMEDTGLGDYGLATLLNDVKQIESETGGPLLVCSSNGTSLCGIYIALDMMLDEFESTKHVQVRPLVKQLLQQKPNLIKDETEYQFLHLTFLSVVDRLLEKRSPFWKKRKQRE